MSKKGRSNIAAYISLLLYSLLIGFTFLIVKQSVTETGPLQILFFRFALALVSVLILMLIRVVRVDFKGKGKKINLLLEGVCYVGFLGLQAYSLQYTSSVLSGIVFACVPVIAAIFARMILKEHTNAVQTVFMAMSIAAVIVVTVLGKSISSVNWVGIALLFGSVVCSALASVFMRSVKNAYSPYDVSLVNALIGTLAFGVMAAIQNKVSGEAWAGFFEPITHTGFIFYILYLGIGCTFVSSALQSYALKSLSTVRVSIWSNLSSVISLVAGALILKEELNVYQILCAAVIIICVICVNLFAGKKKR